jgi:hypothetical protein
LESEEVALKVLWDEYEEKKAKVEQRREEKEATKKNETLEKEKKEMEDRSAMEAMLLGVCTQWETDGGDSGDDSYRHSPIARCLPKANACSKIKGCEGWNGEFFVINAQSDTRVSLFLVASKAKQNGSNNSGRFRGSGQLHLRGVCRKNALSQICVAKTFCSLVSIG